MELSSGVTDSNDAFWNSDPDDLTQILSRDCWMPQSTLLKMSRFDEKESALYPDSVKGQSDLFWDYLNEMSWLWNLGFCVLLQDELKINPK